MKNAFNDAESAYQCLFPEDDSGEKKCVALSFAATAIAQCSAAQALYYGNPDLEHYELPGLFVDFETFVHEIQGAYATDHSIQWVGNHFNKLKEDFENSICSLSYTKLKHGGD